ncbi:hypothetical protein LTR22_024752 [Elasticomyces elasticus]|nr:hypothetical protein LTR22_024752 [Elasticomyces elasticus]KAK4903911.1 hypothetical protein LTR49_026543 [Elasticomyces elasticus]
MPQILPTASRNGQVVVVIVAFTLVVVFLCLLTRLIVRWPWRKLMSSNDYLAFAATVREKVGQRRKDVQLIAQVFSICNAIALCAGVQQGLGEQLDMLSEEAALAVRKAFLVGHLFYYLCASCAISSVVEFLFAIKGTVRAPLLVLLRWLTPAWGAAGTTLMAAFIGVTGHNESKSIQPAAFITLVVMGCIIELLTFVAAAMITIPLQISRKKRAQVMMGFSPSLM